jgi:hypothetical protein
LSAAGGWAASRSCCAAAARCPSVHVQPQLQLALLLPWLLAWLLMAPLLV